MHDVKQELTRRFPELGIQNPYHVFSSNTPLLELAYADDLLFFSRSSVVLQEVLTTLQKHAAIYNMSLNTDKTCVLHMNDPTPRPIFFFTPHSPNTDTVRAMNTTKYLGMAINNKGTLKSHITPKLATARQSFNKLQRLWSHHNIERQFKLKIYKGIFPPMVLYALHHDWHIKSTLGKIDAWHCRLLRRTMSVKTTMIDRTKSNKWVYQHAKSEPLSEHLRKQQIKYFGHIARHPNDIIHKVCYGPPHVPRTLNATRRRGRPRHHWQPNLERITIDACAAAARKPDNRQQLFKICEDRKFFNKLTVHGTSAREAQHAGGGQ